MVNLLEEKERAQKCTLSTPVFRQSASSLWWYDNKKMTLQRVNKRPLFGLEMGEKWESRPGHGAAGLAPAATLVVGLSGYV